MLTINERPHIEEVLSTEDGYRTRTLCLVDGVPAEVEIIVDTHRQKYSSYDIRVYDYIEGRWKPLYALNHGEVGRMPILHDEPETLTKLQKVADILWQIGSTVYRTARAIAEKTEVDDYVRTRMALDEARSAAAWASEIPEEVTALSPAAQKFTEDAQAVTPGRKVEGE